MKGKKKRLIWNILSNLLWPIFLCVVCIILGCFNNFSGYGEPVLKETHELVSLNEAFPDDNYDGTYYLNILIDNESNYITYCINSLTVRQLITRYIDVTIDDSNIDTPIVEVYEKKVKSSFLTFGLLPEDRYVIKVPTDNILYTLSTTIYQD